MSMGTPITFKLRKRSWLETVLLPLHGADPSRFDLMLIHGAGLSAALLWSGLALRAKLPYAWWQMMLVSFLLWDLVGGALSNLTDSTSDWYRQRSFAGNVAFLVLHLVHPLVATLALGLGNWAWVAFLWLFSLLAGTLILRLVGHPSQRTSAGFFVVFGWLVSMFFFKAPSELVWFTPVFLFKLVYCFSVDHRNTASGVEMDRSRLRSDSQSGLTAVSASRSSYDSLRSTRR